MSSKPRKNRTAFRPTLGDVQLEERVVMSVSAANSAFVTRLASLHNGLLGQSARANRAGQARLDAASLVQLRNAYRQQFHASQTALRTYANSQIANLFNNPANRGADGRITAQAVTDLRNSLDGAINATALQLSSQASLLPGSADRLVPGLQNSLLGSQASSLASRIASQLNSPRSARLTLGQLQNAINRQVNTSFAGNTNRLNSFLRTTPLNRLSIDSTTGQRIPLSQFMGNQAIQQINNTFGTLANSVGPLAQSSLFDSTGAFNSQAVNGFQQQFNNALSTAGFQTGSLLSMFPNASGLQSQLQSALFGNGTNPTTGLPVTSFATSLSDVFRTNTGTGATPLTSDLFNTSFQNGFTNAFQNFSTPIGSFFGAQPTTGQFQLPSGFFQSGSTFPSIFGSQFTSNNFNSGFNNGFSNTGSGFIGLGTAPSGFSNSFGTGFNDLVTAANGTFGLTQPTNLGGTGLNNSGGQAGGLSGGTGTGIGTGTGGAVII